MPEPANNGLSRAVAFLLDPGVRVRTALIVLSTISLSIVVFLEQHILHHQPVILRLSDLLGMYLFVFCFSLLFSYSVLNIGRFYIFPSSIIYDSFRLIFLFYFAALSIKYYYYLETGGLYRCIYQDTTFLTCYFSEKLFLSNFIVSYGYVINALPFVIFLLLIRGATIWLRKQFSGRI